MGADAGRQEVLRRLREATHAVLARQQEARTAVAALLGAVVAADLVLLGVVALVARAQLAGLLLAEGVYLFTGREPAILFALGTSTPPSPLPLLAAVVLVDFFLLLSSYWVFTRWVHWMRHRPALSAVLLSLEKRVYRHRRAIDRWGLVGLAAFVWIPAFGTGVVAATLLGVVGRIRPQRLLVVLAISVTLVNAFWTASLTGLAGLGFVTPRVVTTVAWVLVVLLLVAAGVQLWRDRTGRNVPVVKLRRPLAPARLRRLEELGLSLRGDVLRVDCRVLAMRADLSEDSMQHCRAVSELLLLPGVDPPLADALASVGIVTIRELAVAPTDLLREALGWTRGSGRFDEIPQVQRAASRFSAAGS